jgi:16S rRNA (guanine527-N7)-methyltransferase
MQKDALSASSIARRLESAGLDLAPEPIGKLTRFLELLMQWNRVYNLTGIRDPHELVERHIIESLALAALLGGERIADIGTGAGLPGIPLAIAVPQRAFTLIESRAKRVAFLRHVTGELGLGNVQIAHCRAEHLRPERPFDTVLARAVAPPAELLDIVRLLTAPGSILLLLTAGHLEAEFRRLAEDFTVRRVQDRGARRLRGSILLLERA